MIGCSSNRDREPRSDADPRKEIAQRYCSSCHLYVQPELLDRSSWFKVLNAMEEQMVEVSMEIKKEEWIDLQQFYLENAPATLQEQRKAKMNQSSLFKFADVLDSVPGGMAQITSVNVTADGKVIHFGDATGRLVEFADGKIDRTVSMGNCVIQVEEVDDGEGLLALDIGSLMPSHATNGKLVHSAANIQNVIIDSMRRPVHFVTADLDGNETPEYIISNFGATVNALNTGGLSLYRELSGKYVEIVLSLRPGATKSIVRDFNSDGKPDIMALFAQGREMISIFWNKGNFQFSEQPLLEFLPIFGSNDFELADMNGDSHPDIVLTQGDNGDFSSVFKDFHGVRVYLNNGNYQFAESYFYPINGASQVLVEDFDLDGDPDMVVLAMFPDLFRWSEETIVYFENLGSFEFKPAYIQKEPSAKWFRMASGDIDDDGDIDLILGANYRIKLILTPPEYAELWGRNRISYGVLINTRF